MGPPKHSSRPRYMHDNYSSFVRVDLRRTCHHLAARSGSPSSIFHGVYVLLKLARNTSSTSSTTFNRFVRQETITCFTRDLSTSEPRGRDIFPGLHVRPIPRGSDPTAGPSQQRALVHLDTEKLSGSNKAIFRASRKEVLYETEVAFEGTQSWYRCSPVGIYCKAKERILDSFSRTQL